VLTTALAYLLYARGLRTTAVTTATTLGLAEPGPRKAPPHRASHRRRAADEDRSGGRAAVIAAFAARGSGLTCP
jgi:hypothetical protein